MFEWLEREIAAIKTPRFHLVDGPADAKLHEAVIQSNARLPRSYKKFVLKFGNARLYRRAGNDIYQVGVFGGPREVMLTEGKRIYHIGLNDGASVHVKPVSKSAKRPIFEFESGSEDRVADDFEDWLSASCAHARKSFGREKWEEILRGPEPFTPLEQEIIETRRQIHWRVLGIDEDGNHVFEVSNAGKRTLDVLTVGVHSKDRRLNGAVRLKIGHIGPGQTAVLHRDCYKDLMPSHELEAFALPDPRPEDREAYHELGNLE
jgi:hypothetical protein